MSRHLGSYSELTGPKGRVITDFVEANIPALWQRVSDTIENVTNTADQYTGLVLDADGAQVPIAELELEDKLFWFTPHVANNLGADLSLNGSAFRPILDYNGAVIAANALVPTERYPLRFNSNTYRLAVPDVSGLADSSKTITGAGLASGGGDLTANRVITVEEASQAETLAGVIQNKAVTPLRLAQKLADISVVPVGLALGGGPLSADMFIEVPAADQAEAEAAALNDVAMTPLRTRQLVTAAEASQAEAEAAIVSAADGIMSPRRTINTIDALAVRSLAQRIPSPILDAWSGKRTPGNVGWLGLCYSPELKLFVAVGGTGGVNGIMTSVDGEVWTPQTPPAGDKQWADVIWVSQLSLFVAVAIGAGPDTERVMTSPDGVTWTLRTTPDRSWRGVAYSPDLGLFVAVANATVAAGIRVMTSGDGITWTIGTYAFANEPWTSIMWAPAPISLFIATSADVINGPVMTSPDGFTWTRRDNGVATKHFEEAWQAVAYSPTLQLLVCAKNTGTNVTPSVPASIDHSLRFMTSPDGINWTPRSVTQVEFDTSPLGYVSYHDVIWVPEYELFVAVGNTGVYSQVATSKDGITWTTRQTAHQASWQHLTWNPDRGVLACIADRTTPTPPSQQVMISTSGKALARRPSFVGRGASNIIILKADAPAGAVNIVNGSIVVVNASGLSELRIYAGQTAYINYLIRYDSAANADFRFTIAKIAGLATVTGRFWPAAGGIWNAADAWTRQGTEALGTELVVGGVGAAVFHPLSIWARVIASVTGSVRDSADIAFRFAQGTSQASDTRLHDDSFAIVYITNNVG